ncbi:venom metalloproteinase antarease TserMP_A-like [Dermacentor variabilis]|uniref:venom metalloproteinase antarease TserMP_A-like n=1 Tax=Dermacentor variabilis TaxID=34621 RepID=UPI003F5BD22E
MQFIPFLKIVYLAYICTSCHAANSPTYRAVVYPQLFEGRDENTKVLKINDEITLNLQPSSILHDEFFLRKYRQGVSEYRYFDVETLQQDLYHDSRQLAAVVVSEEDGVLRVEGVVGPKLKIRPIEASERSEYGPEAHLVDTIEDSDSDNVYGKLVDEKTMISERARNDRYGFDPSAYSVETIFPEVLITCDSVFHREFRSTKKMLKYVMVTFQVVVIRYLGVRNPRVRPILRGIELTNYTQEHIYYTYLPGGGIDALKSLYSIKDYVARKTTLYANFDLLYFITGHDMIALQGSRRESALSGFAFVGSACLASRQQLGEDTAYSYRGIRIMAHEIAHTLGCSHDGTAVDGHLRGFKADSSRCPWSDGYIMSYIEEDVRSMKFSTCCDYDISQYSWMYGADCLRRNSTKKISKRWRKVFKLPGEVLSRNEQCKLTYPDLKRTYYMEAKGIKECRVYCFVPGDQFGGADYYWPMYLIDGSTCRNEPKQICINGQCMQDRRKRKRRKKNRKVKSSDEC